MGYDVEVKDLPARHVAMIRVTTTPDKMGQTFGEVIPELWAYLEKEGVQPSGPSFGVFHSYGEEVGMEAGFPVETPVKGEGRVMGGRLDAATCAVTWHEGSYATIGEAHRALEGWIKDNGREQAGPPWEVYWEGPGSGKSPSEFRTEVGYPIR
jgi:effector-binding domain-containing protein